MTTMMVMMHRQRGMMAGILLFCCAAVLLFVQSTAKTISGNSNGNDNGDTHQDESMVVAAMEERIEDIKMDLWSRGAFALDDRSLWFGSDDRSMSTMERLQRMEFLRSVAPMRLGPVRSVRAEQRRMSSSPSPPKGVGSDSIAGWMDELLSMRGGAGSSLYDDGMAATIEKLGKTLGSDFLDAIELVRVSCSFPSVEPWIDTESRACAFHRFPVSSSWCFLLGFCWFFFSSHESPLLTQCVCELFCAW